MTPRQAEAMLRDTLTQEALTLERLHELARAGGSAWSVDQLRLFLRCVPKVEYDQVSNRYRVTQRTLEAELRDAVLAAVRSFSGRPVPASEIRRRLPAHLITTDEQIRALAKRTEGLELIGPGLIRLAK